MPPAATGTRRWVFTRAWGATLTRLDSLGLEMWAFPMGIQSYGATGALVRMPSFPVGRNSTIGPYGFIALVFDTEGNMIGLHAMK